jgi:hypothetical protein
MNLARQIRLVLGVARSTPVAIETQTDASALPSMAWLGFPDLVSRTFFLSVPATEAWQRHAVLAFPDRCCVCMAPASRRLAPVEPKGLWGRLHPGPLSACIPHCAPHAAEAVARLLVHVGGWSPETSYANLIGFNRAFLEETAAANRVGDTFPPWRAFPGAPAGSATFRQGNGEHWRREAWHPFWTNLDDLARRDYLDRWSAPQDWRTGPPDLRSGACGAIDRK